MSTEETPSSRWPRRDLVVALVALGVAAAGALAVSSAPSDGSLGLIVLGYVVVWLPLLVAAVLVRARGWGGGNAIAWRVTLLDVLWGLGAGLLLLVVASLVEAGIRGDASLPGVVLPAQPSAVEIAMIALTLVVAPVIIAPIVEELFFRGTLLSALRPASAARWVSVAAVVGAALLFALPHAITAVTEVDRAVAVASALVLGVGAGALAVATRRIGASVFAHAAFNGALVVVVLL